MTTGVYFYTRLQSDALPTELRKVSMPKVISQVDAPGKNGSIYRQAKILNLGRRSTTLHVC